MLRGAWYSKGEGFTLPILPRAVSARLVAHPQPLTSWLARVAQRVLNRTRASGGVGGWPTAIRRYDDPAHPWDDDPRARRMTTRTGRPPTLSTWTS